LSQPSASRPPPAEPKARAKHDRSKTAAAQLRSCVGCRQKVAPAELTRWVFAGGASVLPDLARRSFGRGAWLHPQPGCFKKAGAGFSRAFKTPIKISGAELASLLDSAAERRVASLLVVARRCRRLAIGKTAVEKELARERCALLIVAVDARTAASSYEVQAAIAKGRAVGWGSKAVLGGLTGRTEVGVLAVLDDGLASAVKETIGVAQAANRAATASSQGVGQGEQDHTARMESECTTEVG
jgi:hypothetical protein